MAATQPVSLTEIESLKRKAEAVHVAALNLAMTYGIFHGINSARTLPAVNIQVTEAINSIQHDLLHLMAIRLCALCDHGPRADDASIIALERSVTKQVREHLINADHKWRQAIGLRAVRVTDVSKSIANLRRRRTTLHAQDAALRRVQHFRNKLLAHITVSHNPANKVILRELWHLSRVALIAARSVRLIFHRSDWNYLDEAKEAERKGKALAKVVVAKSH